MCSAVQSLEDAISMLTGLGGGRQTLKHDREGGGAELGGGWGLKKSETRTNGATAAGAELRARSHDGNTSQMSVAKRRQQLSDLLIENAVPLPEATLAACDTALIRSGGVDPQLPLLAAPSRLPGARWFAVRGGPTTSSTCTDDDERGGQISHSVVVGVWRGDMRRLAVDAAVNAANKQGLGCFQPHHRCIDNVLHRAAGPRLRESCRAALQPSAANASGELRTLNVGGVPIVTPGHLLPARHVMHVVGPCLPPSPERAPTPEEEEQLRGCYRRCLDAAEVRRLRSIAFPCISTGLFNFPRQRAALLALETVAGWLHAHPGTSLRVVIFNTFLADDFAAYLDPDALPMWLTPVNRPAMPSIGGMKTAPMPSPILSAGLDDAALAIADAARWVRDAERVLVVAGAGMSAMEGMNVYSSPGDFAAHYPWMPRRGYRTAYEAMSLFSDSNLTMSEKWAYQAQHMANMRFSNEPPCLGYSLLRSLVAGKDCFILTSNVDGGFLRAGFSAQNIYRPQGDWENYQCLGPCAADSVWPSREMIQRTLSLLTPGGASLATAADVPACPRCGGDVYGNVRGGEWFLDGPYDDERQQFGAWVGRAIADAPRVPLVVLEIGAGFNTPSVTRWRAEAIAAKADTPLIRINPTPEHAVIPAGLRGAGLPYGWEVLADIALSIDDARSS